MEQHFPQQHSRGHRDRHRDQETTLKKLDMLPQRIQDQRRQKGQCQKQRDTDPLKTQSIHRRQAKRLIGKDRPEIGKPHPCAADRFCKRAAHHIRKRDQDKEQDS